MRKLALGLAILSSILILAGIGGYFFLYPGGLGTDMAARLTARTGQPVVFPKAARLIVWPNPRIVFDDVHIGPANKPLVRIAQMKISTSLSALGAGTVNFDSVVLEGAQITLAQDAQGISTWNGTVAADLEPVTVRLKDSTIAFEGARAGSHFTATGLEGSVTFSKGGLEANGTLIWNGQPVQAKVFLGSLDRLSTDGSPAALTLAGPLFNAVFEGRLGLRNGLACVGIATISAKDLRAFLVWSGLPMGGTRALRNFTVSGPVDYSQGTLMLKDDALALDGAIGRGTLLVSSSADGPAFSGTLDLDRLNIDIWRAPAGGAPWDQQALTLSELSGYRADLAITARSLILWTVASGPASLTVKVAGSKLDLDVQSLALSGGQMSARLGLFRDNNLPTLTLQAEARGVELRGLFPHLSGLANGKANLRAAGMTGEEMISRLGGTASAQMPGGTLPGIDLKAIVVQAAQGPVTGWGVAQNSATAFSDLGIVTNISDGIFKLSSSGLTVAGLPIEVSGKIDALRRAIDLTFSPKLPQGPVPTGQPAAPDLHAVGPWGSPRFFQQAQAKPAKPSAPRATPAPVSPPPSDAPGPAP